MRLLIISNMSHYLRDGQIVGWGPTVEEISHLATLFDSVRHLGCLHTGAAPNSALPYTRENITLVPLPPAGGNALKDKVGIIRLLPLYLSAIIRELKQCDVVHLRCPANIPLLALLVLIFTKKPAIRWAKYAGNWNAGKKSPIFYRLQRWLLKTGICKCEATVNGKWPDQKEFIHSFYNPCLTTEEIQDASFASARKEFVAPYRLIFVGALNPRKGVERLLKIAFRLNQENIPFLLDILGDGPDRDKYQTWCIEQRINSQVLFHGWIPKNELSSFYAKAHLNILPSESEGWPKVLSEGMAYGAVPLAGSVASIPQVLLETQSGFAISPYDDISGYVDVVKKFVNHPDLWENYAKNSQASAALFTYESYLISVKRLFHFCWGIRL